MSMSTEQANEYLEKLAANKSETKEEVKEPITPAEPEVKDQEPVTPTETPEDKDKGVEPPVETKPTDDKDEPKPADSDKKDTSEPKPEDKPAKEDKAKDKKAQRDYAFLHEKQKRKQMKQKYEARIAELEKELEQHKGLTSNNFKNNDGSVNTDAYVDWKLKEQQMQSEVANLRSTDEREQRDFEELEYRNTVESCFPDEAERSEYDDLIAKNGPAFYNALQDEDPNGVVLGYLNTVKQYPIVLKELLVNPKRWLPGIFISRDPEEMKRNTAQVAYQILNEHYAPKPVTAAVKPAAAPAPAPAAPAMPIVGKQITTNTVGAQELRGSAAWNQYLRERPKG